MTILIITRFRRRRQQRLHNPFSDRSAYACPSPLYTHRLRRPLYPPAQQTTLDDLVRRDADNGDVDGGRRLALGRDPDQ